MSESEGGRQAFALASTKSGPSELRVEVLGDEVIIILPATSYGVIYYKPTRSTHLLVKNFLSKFDRGPLMTQEEFLARAWQAANEKAHELGWIIDPGRRMIRDYCHSLGVGKVEMRRVGIAGIAEQPERLTCCHLVARLTRKLPGCMCA